MLRLRSRVPWARAPRPRLGIQWRSVATHISPWVDADDDNADSVDQIRRPPPRFVRAGPGFRSGVAWLERHSNTAATPAAAAAATDRPIHSHPAFLCPISYSAPSFFPLDAAHFSDDEHQHRRRRRHRPRHHHHPSLARVWNPQTTPQQQQQQQLLLPQQQQRRHLWHSARPFQRPQPRIGSATNPLGMLTHARGFAEGASDDRSEKQPRASATPKAKTTARKAAPWLEEEEPAMTAKLAGALRDLPGQTFNLVARLAKWIARCLAQPSHFAETMAGIWGSIKHEFQHYKTGTKLLLADIKLASNILRRVLQGYSLSRRERKQLRRTAKDILRVGPLAMFVIIPGMELALPFALKIFPNMLPSTFKETLKEKEDKKRLLRARIEMTTFFQSTLREFAEETKKKARAREEQIELRQREKEEHRREALLAKGEGDDAAAAAAAAVEGMDNEWAAAPPSAEDEKDRQQIKVELNRASKLMDAIDAVREGAAVDADTIIEMSQLFKDSITLDTVSRSHLVAMCKYMGLNAFGSDPFLRFQLRSAIRDIREDDQSILWEGPESLSTEELKIACDERGMRASGLSRGEYVDQLQHWLDMSVNKNVPLTLLVMSRAFLFTLSNPTAEDEKAALQEAVSQLDEDVIVDAVIEAAESTVVAMDAEEAAKEKQVLTELKLERLERQMELIEEEREEAAEIDLLEEEESKEAAAAEDSAGSEGTAVAGKVAGTAHDGVHSDAAAKVLTASSGGAKTDVDPAFVPFDAEVPATRIVLSQAEIEALESLASNSALQAERSLLEKLKMLSHQAEVSDMLAIESDARKKLQSAGGDEAAGALEVDDYNRPSSGSGDGPDDFFRPVVDAAAMASQIVEAKIKGVTISDVDKGVGRTDIRKDELPLPAGASGVAAQEADGVSSTAAVDEDAKGRGADSDRDEDEDGRGDSDEEEEDDDEDDSVVDMLDDEVEKDAEVVRRGRKRLESMLRRLEKEIEEADREIGSSLNLLDQNHDGICTTEELRNAFLHVLADHDHVEADALVERMDPTHRGYFQISDLHDLLEGLQLDDERKAIFEYIGKEGEGNKDDD